MNSLLKTFAIYVLIASATATLQVPTIGSLDERHCAGGNVTDVVVLDYATGVTMTTVMCPNGIPEVDSSPAERSLLEARQPVECSPGCMNPTPVTCLPPPGPAASDCSSLVFGLSQSGVTFIAAAGSVTLSSSGTCTCAFIARAAVEIVGETREYGAMVRHARSLLKSPLNEELDDRAEEELGSCGGL
ncbi:hypothetical protein GGX14DRAFT_395526 [Mycena pura]|uniref:Uncharacterized protein n=1 Tax=Mycena pura TaxID=153505 RepID=A0AAD6VGE1_9AGAR|nr:hypothetical protein GGX14DRAFT_395526 [Mycena pura]